MWSSLAIALACLVQEPPPPAPPTQDIAGTVQGVVAGETVRVTIWQYDMHRDAAEPIADGRADANGAFAFKGVPWMRDHDWGFHSMLVIAKAGERAIGLRELRGDAADCKRVAVELTPTIAMTGSVRTANGTPIANAAIEPYYFLFGTGDANAVLLGPNLTWHTRSDPKGQFVVRGVPKGVRMHLRVRHPDFAEATLFGVDAAARCDVDLRPGGVLTGTVRLPDGKPAVRAVVSVQGHAPGAYLFKQVSTDDAGCYRVASLPEGMFNVWAESDEYTVVALHAVRVAVGETVAEQNLAYVSGGWIVGRVIDDATGASVQPGATADVGMSGPARPPETGIQCATVRADGTFRIRAPAGQNHVYLRVGAGWNETGRSAGDFEVVDGQETQVEFRARRVKAK